MIFLHDVSAQWSVFTHSLHSLLLIPGLWPRPRRLCRILAAAAVALEDENPLLCRRLAAADTSQKKKTYKQDLQGCGLIEATQTYLGIAILWQLFT